LVRSPLARQVVALGLALSVVALSLAYPLRGYLQQQTAEQQAIVEQQSLEARILDLKAEIAALKDPAYIRAEAKRRLQFVTPGDTVYVVKLPKSVTESPAGPDVAAGAAESDGAVDVASAGTAGPASGTAGPASGTAGFASGTGDDADTSPPWYRSLWSTLSGDES
jgi:cell division protein FtsB